MRTASSTGMGGICVCAVVGAAVPMSSSAPTSSFFIFIVLVWLIT